MNNCDRSRNPISDRSSGDIGIDVSTWWRRENGRVLQAQLAPQTKQGGVVPGCSRSERLQLLVT